ncbi:heavy metal sensor histidine kinase [Thorsellia anophelis]|uniref:Sensor protein n=1 Tax=Thorsellia anophelis DSM 18579 TaxID=1123402 RepID=A0A1I0B3Z0_9GAMM|nr:heavy metal sensor histidine kinase [Thorsellia anophelis]SET01488.1 HAMP domain-containing protein [Thorsellia anophelis DSM 18579]
MTRSLTLTVGALLLLTLISVTLLVERSITHHFEMQDNAQLTSFANTIANNQHRMQQTMSFHGLNQSLNMHQPIFAYTASFSFNAMLDNHSSFISSISIMNFINEINEKDKLLIDKKVGQFLETLTPTEIKQHLSHQYEKNTHRHISHSDEVQDAYLFKSWQSDLTHYRVIILLLPEGQHTHQLQSSTKQPNDNSTLTIKAVIVGLDTQFHEHYLKELRLQLLALSIFMALLVMFFAYILVKRGHKPIHKISLTLDHIATGKLKTRITQEKYPIELKTLIQSFNQMMDKIDSLFEKQGSFSADIAHELRTPMTNLITQTQIILQRPRDNHAYEEVLYANLEEFERLSKMINDMLFLAQADNQAILPDLGQFNFLNLINNILDYFDALTEDNQVSFALSVDSALSATDEISQFNVVGNESMMQRALSNIILNAILYSSPNSKINITLTYSDETITFSIQNKIDSPIDNSQLDKLFDRFYRLDPARGKHQDKEGFGIGLSITQAIIKAHQGSIRITSENLCFVITLTLPCQQQYD